MCAGRLIERHCQRNMCAERQFLKLCAERQFLKLCSERRIERKYLGNMCDIFSANFHGALNCTELRAKIGGHLSVERSIERKFTLRSEF